MYLTHISIRYSIYYKCN